MHHAVTRCRRQRTFGPAVQLADTASLQSAALGIESCAWFDTCWSVLRFYQRRTVCCTSTDQLQMSRRRTVLPFIVGSLPCCCCCCWKCSHRFYPVCLVAGVKFYIRYTQHRGRGVGKMSVTVCRWRNIMMQKVRRCQSKQNCRRVSIAAAVAATLQST